jgi:hypothetical protein
MARRKRAVSRGKAKILAIHLRVRGPDGREYDVELEDVRNVDAIVWSLAAVEKFLVPFYVIRNDFEEANNLYNEALDQLEKYGMVVVKHKLGCNAVIPKIRWGRSPLSW